MTIILRRCLPVLAAATLCASLAACGAADDAATPGAASSAKAEAPKKADKPSSGALYKQTREAALAAKSGHVKGTLTEKGEETTIDMAGTADGSNLQATFTTSEGEFTMLAVGGRYWIKGNEKYWTSSAGADAAKAIGTKWFSVPAAEAKDMGDTNLKSLLTEIFSDEGMSKLQSMATEVGERTVSGVDAYVLADKVGDSGELITTADGKAHLIKIVGPKDEPGEIVFSEWDSVKAFAAPATAQVFTP